MRKTIISILAALMIFACDDIDRNSYMLRDEYKLADNGYDWWWHSFVATNKATGERRPFFIEYYIINPALGGPDPILGQLPENKALGIRPSYGMVMAGTWGADAKQIHNFYGIDNVSASLEKMDVRIGTNTATETHLQGSVFLSESDAVNHPEYMSDAGSINWNLDITKDLSYSVGYAASDIFREINAFQMFWHVAGMKARLSGSLIYNGQEYEVKPEDSYGYQDKNWGNDYTNPWVWLNCNNFVSEKTGESLPLTSLDVGGGNPQAFGISLGKKVLIAFYHEGELYEWNFTKLWKLQYQKFNVDTGGEEIVWDIMGQDTKHKIEIRFSNPKSKMLKINYENPAGEKNHQNLWNGGHASGTVKLYKKSLFGWKLIDTFHGQNGGSEIGEY